MRVLGHCIIVFHQKHGRQLSEIEYRFMRLCRLLFPWPVPMSQRIPYGLFYQVLVTALRSLHLQYPCLPFRR